MAAKAVKPTIRFAADFDAYKRELKRALGQTDKFDRSLKGAGKRNNFRSIGKAALGAAAGIGAVSIAANELKKSITQTTDLAKATRQLQRATGLASEDASRLAAVLKVRGVDTDKLGRSFTTLARQIESAKTGTGAAADAFRKLGVAQGAIRNGDVSSILIQSADGFKRLGDSTTKAQVAQQLFGRSSRDLIPLLEGGGKALREQLALAPKLTEAQKQQALTLPAAQRNFALALMSLRVAIATAALPYLSKLATAISTFVTQAQMGTGAGGAFRDRIVAISDAINRLVSPLTQTNDRLANFAVAIAGVGTALAGGKVLSSVLGLGGALGALVSNPWLAAAAGAAVVIAGIGAAAILAYKRSKAFRDVVDDIGRTLRPTFKSVGEQARKQLPIVGREFGRLAKNLAELLRELKPAIVPIVKLLAAGLRAELSMIPVRLAVVAKGVRTTTSVLRVMRSVIATVVRATGDFRRAVQVGFGAALDPIRAVINAIKALLKEAKKLPGVSSLGKILGVVSGRQASAAGAPRLRAAQAASMGPRLGARAAGSVYAPKPLEGGPLYGYGKPNEANIAERTLQLTEAIGKAETRIARLQDRKDKAGRTALKRYREFLSDAKRELSDLERANTILQARRSLEDQIGQARLKQLNRPIDARDAARQRARNQNALEDFQKEYARLTGEMGVSADFTTRNKELTDLIAQTRGEQGNAAVQASYQRQRTRLNAQIARADARGDLDAKDQLNQQLAALEERYGADRLQRLINEQNALRAEEDKRRKDAKEERDRLVLEEQQRNDDIKRANNEAAAAVYAFTGAVKKLIDYVTQPSGGVGMPFEEFVKRLLKLGGPAVSKTDETAGILGRKKGVPLPFFPNRKGKASGGMLTPGALTLVGETGPELIMASGRGMSVVSGTRTQRLGGDTNITINATGAAANDPRLLAREIGWQLATR